MPVPVSLIAEEPCWCPEPPSYQRSHHSMVSQPGPPSFPLLFSSLPYNQRTHLELLWKHWVPAMAVVLQLIPGQIRKGCRYSLGREEIKKILKKLLKITFWTKYCLHTDWYVNKCWSSVQNYLWVWGLMVAVPAFFNPCPELRKSIHLSSGKWEPFTWKETAHTALYFCLCPWKSITSQTFFQSHFLIGKNFL